MVSEELANVLNMSLYGILNGLYNQMSKNNTNKEWIGFDAVNGIDKCEYRLRVCLEKIGDD